jgi:hypothetical protein
MGLLPKHHSNVCPAVQKFAQWGGFSIRHRYYKIEDMSSGLTAQACPLRVKIRPTFLNTQQHHH